MTKYTATESAALKAVEKTNLTRKKEEEAIHALIDDHQGLVKWVLDLAVHNGMSERNPNLYDAQLVVESICQTNLETNRLLTEAGYTSVPDLLRRHKRQLTRHDQVIAQLPPVFQKTPVKLVLNKSNLELGRVERTMRRVRNELLDTFDVGVSDVEQAEIAEAWADLETLDDLEKFLTELIKFNNNYEEPAPPETVPTSSMIERFDLADKFSVVFIADLIETVQSTTVEIDRKESIYRTNTNPNNLVEFILWQHLAPEMSELLFLRHMGDFAVYLEDKGLATPQGKKLESGLTASAEHRYDWKWSESVCLNDLREYFEVNNIKITHPESTAEDLETLEVTEEELLGCL